MSESPSPTQETGDRRGTRTGTDATFEDFVHELRAIAAHAFEGERTDHTLQPTAIVSEAWLRLMQRPESAFTNVIAFRAWASKVVRHILVDYARARGTDKRFGEKSDIDVFEVEHANHGLTPEELIDLNNALVQLELKQPRLARIVELRFFGGMSVPEVCEELGIRQSRAKAEWEMARVLLRRALRG
jgi:RNA polymerase sigma-70 factor, ECF subfamily